MRTESCWLGAAMLACVAGLDCLAANIEPGTAVCRPTGGDSSTCALAWDLSAEPRTYYRVERLDANRQAWVPIDTPFSHDPYGAGVAVAVDELYRVRACDDRKFRRNCISSTAVWAVTLMPVDDIPTEVTIADPPDPSAKRGSSDSVASVSKSLDAYGQNSQYNVYRMTDRVNRAGSAELPPMKPPAEPAAADDLEHQIQHNVQQAYEALRVFRQRQRKVPERIAND